MINVKLAVLAFAVMLLFSGPVGADEPLQDSHERTAGFAWHRLVVPVGVLTLALLLATAGAGLFMRKKPRFLRKWHKRLALSAIIAALCHATLVSLTH